MASYQYSQPSNSRRPVPQAQFSRPTYAQQQGRTDEYQRRNGTYDGVAGRGDGYGQEQWQSHNTSYQAPDDGAWQDGYREEPRHQQSINDGYSQSQGQPRHQASRQDYHYDERYHANGQLDTPSTSRSNVSSRQDAPKLGSRKPSEQSQYSQHSQQDRAHKSPHKQRILQPTSPKNIAWDNPFGVFPGTKKDTESKRRPSEGERPKSAARNRAQPTMGEMPRPSTSNGIRPPAFDEPPPTPSAPFMHNQEQRPHTSNGHRNDSRGPGSIRPPPDVPDLQMRVQEGRIEQREGRMEQSAGTPGPGREQGRFELPHHLAPQRSATEALPLREDDRRYDYQHQSTPVPQDRRHHTRHASLEDQHDRHRMLKSGDDHEGSMSDSRLGQYHQPATGTRSYARPNPIPHSNSMGARTNGPAQINQQRQYQQHEEYDESSYRGVPLNKLKTPPHDSETPNFAAISANTSEKAEDQMTMTPTAEPASYQNQMYRAADQFQPPGHDSQMRQPQGNDDLRSPLAAFSFDLPPSSGEYQHSQDAHEQERPHERPSQQQSLSPEQYRPGRDQAAPPDPSQFPARGASRVDNGRPINGGFSHPYNRPPPQQGPAGYGETRPAPPYARQGPSRPGTRNGQRDVPSRADFDYNNPDYGHDFGYDNGRERRLPNHPQQRPMPGYGGVADRPRAGGYGNRGPSRPDPGMRPPMEDTADRTRPRVHDGPLRNPRPQDPQQSNQRPMNFEAGRGGPPQGQNIYPPGQNGYPQGQNGYPQGQNGYPQGQNVYPHGQDGYSQGRQRPQTSGSTASGGPQHRRQSSDTRRSSIPTHDPAHPVPIRPGLAAPPVKQQIAPTPPVGAGVAPVSMSTPAPARQERTVVERPREIKATQPVTAAELQMLQEQVRSNPSDHRLGLKLAVKLVEAATVLASDNGRADAKQTAKNREKYILDAHKIVKKLISAGSADAMFYLADCHGQGQLGLAVDPREAFALYQSAAKLNHPQAAYRVAVCCELGADEGGGTRRDPLKSVQWYKRAAALGDPPAMYKMGMIMLKGLLGQPRNPREAVSWLKRAAERASSENPHALHELALLYETAKPDDVIVKDEAYACQLFLQAAELGYKYSQFHLGKAYEWGHLGCPVDARQSIGWYTRAASQGEHQSELALSGWYLTGHPPLLEQSDTEAYLWARKAASSGLALAEYAMGHYTETGIGVAPDLEEAKRWYYRAAAQNHPRARERLEALKRGGARMQKTRVSRSNVGRQNEGDCMIM